MPSQDARTVIRLINEHYRLPPAPEVPASITLKSGFSRTIGLDEKRLHLALRDKSHEYTWGEVVSIYITRMDPLRRDFVTLEIQLPDQELRLDFVPKQGKDSAKWEGVDTEVLNEFLLCYLPLERIEVAVAGETPPRRKDVEAELTRLRKRSRKLSASLKVFLVMAGILAALAVFDGGIVRGVVTFVVYSGMPCLICVFSCRDLSKQIRHQEELMACF